MYEYRMVQTEQNVFVKAGKRQGAAAMYLQTVVDQNVGQGWEFYSVETIGTLEAPGCGCLGILLGKKYELTESYVVVFRRPTSAGTPVVAPPKNS